MKYKSWIVFSIAVCILGFMSVWIWTCRLMGLSHLKMKKFRARGSIRPPSQIGLIFAKIPQITRKSGLTAIDFPLKASKPKILWLVGWFKNEIFFRARGVNSTPKPNRVYQRWKRSWRSRIQKPIVVYKVNPILAKQGCLRPVRALLGVQALDIIGSRAPEGGGRLQDFDPRGGSIAGSSDFWAQSARKGAEGTVLENFEDFFKILPN